MKFPMKCKRQVWGAATVILYNTWTKEHLENPCNSIKSFWDCLYCSYRRSILKGFGVTEYNHP